MSDVYESLRPFGWNAFLHREYLELESKFSKDSRCPERIASERRGEYLLLGPTGTRRAILAGRFRSQYSTEDRPCIGDWVLTDDDRAELARIEHVFSRSGLFARKAAGDTSEIQPIAANVELAMVVVALVPEDSDRAAARRGVNPRRILRYLAAATQARARPVVVLNKSDLRLDCEQLARDLSAELSGTRVIAVSSHTGLGLDDLRSEWSLGETAVLVGSSGVGKSSLTNALLGQALQAIAAVREADNRGRHTTTQRELFLLPNGGLLIDTPGMREFALAGEPEEMVRSEIDELGVSCRFRDCRHQGEPGCAVQAAIDAGMLDAERLTAQQKLERELEHQRARSDARLAQETKRRSRALSRRVREVTKRER